MQKPPDKTNVLSGGEAIDCPLKVKFADNAANSLVKRIVLFTDKIYDIRDFSQIVTHDMTYCIYSQGVRWILAG